MAKPQRLPILRVSELYALNKRGDFTWRTYPGRTGRALRKNAECAALLKLRTRAQLESVAEGMELLARVREARIESASNGNGHQLVIYSQRGLVTQQDRLSFIQDVRAKLMELLKSEITVRDFSFR